MEDCVNSQASLTFKELWQIKNRIISKKEAFRYKLRKILEECNNLSLPEIIEVFSYKSMQQKYNEFCTLYADNKLCHNMNIEDFNCFGCLCPDYLIEVSFDNNLNLYKLGLCGNNSKDGLYKLTETKAAPVRQYFILNCKECLIPHYNGYIEKHIEKEIGKLEKDSYL